jgi:hypothetical protein
MLSREDLAVMKALSKRGVLQRRGRRESRGAVDASRQALPQQSERRVEA